MNAPHESLRRATFPLLVAGLIGHPVFILGYWLIDPAYGSLDPAAIVNSFVGKATVGTLANAFALISCLLAVPATLGAVLVVGDRSPKLAVVGGALSIGGWIAVFGLLILDPVSIQFTLNGPPSKDLVDLFARISTGPTVIALNVLAALHLVGGLLLGIACWRTKVIPLWAAIILTFGGLIHFASNVAGILVVDSLTWIALLIANTTIIQSLRAERT